MFRDRTTKTSKTIPSKVAIEMCDDLSNVWDNLDRIIGDIAYWTRAYDYENGVRMIEKLNLAKGIISNVRYDELCEYIFEEDIVADIERLEKENKEL